MNAVPNPLQRDLKYLTEWMIRTDMGGVYLDGEDSLTWTEKEFQGDLLTLKPRSNDDLFYRWVSDNFMSLFHRLVGKYFKVSGAEQS
jgi:hypothetical protein